MFLPSVQTISNLPGSCRSFPSQRNQRSKHGSSEVRCAGHLAGFLTSMFLRSERDFLVGGWPVPLKNDGVSNSWDDDIPNIWKNKTCSKPPTRYIYIYICICIYMIPFPIHPIHLGVPISSETQCIIWKCPDPVAIYKITALANTYIISPKHQNLLVTCQYHQAQQHYKIGTPRSYEQLY